MSARSRGLPKDAVLPSDPKWVVIETSDGDARRWPTNTTPNPDSEGHVNYMQPLTVDNGQAIKWRMVIGQALAEMHGYPDLKSKSWVLKDWPAGYQFYDHNKGQLDGIVRHDLYLVGSDSVARFRSPAEFIPHAYWLMNDSTRDRHNCACKYCARKPQREISDAFGLSQRQGGSPSQAHFADLPRGDRSRDKRRRALPVREGRVFATVRRAPKPITLPKGPEQHVNPEREKDLRAVLGPKTLGERRWAREGELIWVKLDHPIPVHDREVASEKITFWPGMIEEVLFKAEITPKWTGDITMRDDSDSGLKTGVRCDPKDDNVDPWTIVHKSFYKIKLLVASKTVIYGTDHILPYQSHAPDNDLLTEVQSVVFDLGDVSDELGGMVLPSDAQQGEQAEKAQFKQFESFDPFPTTKPYFTQAEDRRHYFEIAAGAFAVAIQIASRLSMYWTPTDEWKYKLQMPLASPGSTDVWSASRNVLSPAEQHALNQKVLGVQHASDGVPTVQTRFQGLWWGPERIWMGDLVRLKLARYQLAPDGTEVIKKPSGAGKRGLLESKADFVKQSSSPPGQNSTSASADSVMHDADILLPNGNSSVINDRDVEMESQDAIDPHNLGASSRSVFLRVDGLFVAHVLSEDGAGVDNECRMCGMLYELADDDWKADGEEFGDRLPSADLTTPIDSKSNQVSPSSSRGVVASPLRNLAQGKVRPTLAEVINDTASRFAPPTPSSSGLFAPNPELLTEPPIQTNISVTQAAQTNIVDPFVEPSSASMSISLPPSSATSSSTEINHDAKVVDSPDPKTEISAPFNPSLSGPLKAAESVYPTPPPPPSMTFRPILRDGHEAVIPLTTLAGRYYPGLLSNGLLHSRVQAALQTPHARDSKAILALEGFVAGAFNSVDATRFLPRRGHMLREAESVAWRELVNYWRRRVSEKKNAIVIDDD